VVTSLGISTKLRRVTSLICPVSSPVSAEMGDRSRVYRLGI